MFMIDWVDLVSGNFMKPPDEAESGADTLGSDTDRGIIDGEAARHQQSCGVCGRTLLTGERVEVYIDSEHNRSLVVCEICRPAAKRTGYKQVA